MGQNARFDVAAYIRLSREDGDKAESDSIVNQRKLIADYLRGRDDLALYDVYVDDGVTGTHFRRPGFVRMIEDIEAGYVNCVIVKDLSRFGRDYIDTGKYLERYFPEHGVRFISVTDHIDSGKQAYDMLLPIRNIFNEQYARDISEKVHAAIRTKQRAGAFIGAFPSYGYRKAPGDKNRLIPDEYAAGIVRRIFSLYLGGCSKSRIAAILNREGIVCPLEYKRLNGERYQNGRRPQGAPVWTYSTIHRLLQNEMYAGTMVQGRKTQHMRGRQKTAGKDDWIVVPDTHEAIIEQDVWEKTQALLRQRLRTPGTKGRTGKAGAPGAAQVFAGYLRCGDCGRAMVRKGSGGAVRYYCGGYVRGGRQHCSPHSVPHDLLEQAVLDDLSGVLRSQADRLEELAGQACAAQSGGDTLHGARALLRAEREKAGRQKKAAYEDYREGLLERDDYLAYRDACAKREAQLTQRLEELERREGQSKARAQETPWLRQLLASRRLTRLDRETVVEMLQEIRVFADRTIEVTYLFSNPAL